MIQTQEENETMNNESKAIEACRALVAAYDQAIQAGTAVNLAAINDAWRAAQEALKVPAAMALQVGVLECCETSKTRHYDAECKVRSADDGGHWVQVWEYHEPGELPE